MKGSFSEAGGDRASRKAKSSAVKWLGGGGASGGLRRRRLCSAPSYSYPNTGSSTMPDFSRELGVRQHEGIVTKLRSTGLILGAFHSMLRTSASEP